MLGRWGLLIGCEGGCAWRDKGAKRVFCRKGRFGTGVQDCGNGATTKPGGRFGVRCV